MTDARDPFVEHTVSSELIFDGKVLKLFRDRVRRETEAGEWTREIVRHQGAVAVIAVTHEGKLLLERQFRYALARVILELPAGKLDPGESPEACAQRELIEETGYRAGDLRHLGTIHPAVGYSDERIELFLAQSLVHEGHAFDHGEYLEVVEMTLEEAEEAILRGAITDAKTISGLFWARKVLRT
ncbi:MAG: NUDIX hydrolase [Betaproteobacteria bacterium]|nr:NUDIX hydrolase [Betaproteobacteria bacterium]